MKRCLVAVCVLLCLGWTCPVVASTLVEEPGAGERPGVALWIEPMLALPAAAFSAIANSKLLLLPVGLDVPLGPRQSLVMEFTPFYQQGVDCDGTCTSRAFSLALGMSFRLSRERSRGGFFVQPKLLAALERDDVAVYHWEDGTHDSWSATGRQLSVGLDVGYRMPSSEHLVLEFILGGSVGRGWNVPTQYSSVFTGFLADQARQRTNKWVWDINPNLLRVGGRF